MLLLTVERFVVGTSCCIFRQRRIAVVKHLNQLKAGLFDKIFHTYKWQIEKFDRLGGSISDQRLAFAIKYKLNETIELEGMNLEQWFFDPRLDVLLFILAHLPDYDSERALSVL